MFGGDGGQYTTLDKRGTPTNGPKNKEIDNTQGPTSERWLEKKDKKHSQALRTAGMELYKNSKNI